MVEGSSFRLYLKFRTEAENYGPAVQLLKERYGHKNVLKKDSLEKVAPVSNSRAVPQLKRLYGDVESHYKALLAVNVMPHEYTATVVPKLLEKLPMGIQIKLNETKDENEDLKIDELVEEYALLTPVPSMHGNKAKRA